MCKIVISGQVPSLKNSQKVANGHFYTDKKVKDYMDSAKDELKLQWREPILDRVDNITFVFYNRDKRKHDTSNEVDTIMDVIKGIIVKDDDQFCVSSYQVQYAGVDAENPRTELWVDF